MYISVMHKRPLKRFTPPRKLGEESGSEYSDSEYSDSEYSDSYSSWVFLTSSLPRTLRPRFKCLVSTISHGLILISNVQMLEPTWGAQWFGVFKQEIRLFYI